MLICESGMVESHLVLSLSKFLQGIGSRLTVKCDHGTLSLPELLSCLFFSRAPRYTHSLMSIRKGGGEWESMLLGVEARLCRVCREDLYRDKTMLRGGWSRCTLCDEFVHYSCLASGKVSFLKARPRVCKTCRSLQEGTVAPSLKKDGPPVAVPS